MIGEFVSLENTDKKGQRRAPEWKVELLSSRLFNASQFTFVSSHVVHIVPVNRLECRSSLVTVSFHCVTPIDNPLFHVFPLARHRRLPGEHTECDGEVIKPSFQRFTVHLCFFHRCSHRSSKQVRVSLFPLLCQMPVYHA